MRPEISNELLLSVIQAWNPDKANQWWVDSSGELRWDLEYCWYMRWPNGDMYLPHSDMTKASKLVEFLLKDRPELVGDFDPDGWPYLECKKACNGFWTLDPWESNTTPDHMVRRIKSYEYLKEWKEKQENAVNPHDITLSIDGQTIDMIPGEPTVWKTKTLKGVPAPGTYEQLCPHCNGSKEVTDWLGKEPCQSCS